MREKLILAGILGVGAAVRFYRLDLTWFFLDQVRDVSAATGIAAGASFPLLGPRIGWTEAYPGPLYFYLMAIPFSISRDPIAGPVFVALGQLVALVALYRFAKEFFETHVALCATALFAAFPLTIFTARLTWQPGLLPLFVVLYMHALYRLVAQGHSGSVLPLFGLLAVLTQLHPTSIALAGVALLGMLVFRPRVGIAHALAGVALFLLLYLPYLVYEFSHGFENAVALFRGASEHGGAGLDGLASVFKNVLVLFAPALDGFVIEAQWPHVFLTAFRILYHAEAFLFGAGFMICVSRLLAGWRSAGPEEVAERRRIGLLLLWVSVPIVILGTKKTAIWYYYLDVLYPSPFILAAIALAALPSLVFRGVSARRRAAWALSSVVVAIVVCQVYFQFRAQYQVGEQGEMVVQVPKMAINSAASPFERLINLPLGYRHEILRALVRDFGVGEATFFDRVHGAVLGLAVENRYILSYVASRPRGEGTGQASADTHYMVARAGAAHSGLSAIRSTRIGPYAIFEFRPAIDYKSWSYGVISHGRREVAEWKKLRVPASEGALAAGETEQILCRGQLLFPADTRDVTISVGQVGRVPFDVVWLKIDGRPLKRVAQQRRETPWIPQGPSGWVTGKGWTTETVFDLEGSVPPGERAIEIALGGGGTIVGLDVHEGRSW